MKANRMGPKKISWETGKDSPDKLSNGGLRGIAPKRKGNTREKFATKPLMKRASLRENL